ncbi:MAG: electron transport complex protein RnfA [Buchnera aphidicola (Eriosoma harunire)]
MNNFIYIFILNVLVNNFVFVQFLGLCPLMGTSKSMRTAIGMSIATSIVIMLTTILSFFINYFFLIPYKLFFLRTMVYILIIAVSVQFMEIMTKYVSPLLYRSLGVFLPLITTNCIVLAVPLLTYNLHYEFLTTVFYACSVSVGFSMIIIIFSSLRERIDGLNIAIHVRGMPIFLITAGLMSMSFMGFNGLVKM